MFNRCLLFSLFFIQNTLTCELIASKKNITDFYGLQKFYDHMKFIDHVIDIATKILEETTCIKSQIAPSEAELKIKKICEYKIRALTAEANFHKCLVKNAFKARGDNQLPMDCQVAAVRFIDINGIDEFKKIRDEFITVTSEFNKHGDPLPKGWSLKTKIAVGVLIVATAGTGAIILTPILFPGTEAATQAQNIINTTQHAGLALSQIAQDAVKNKIAQVTATKFTIASTGAKVAIATRKTVYPTQAEKLESLIQAKKANCSLSEQIRRSYAITP